MWGDAAPPENRSSDVLVDPYERPTYRQPLMDSSEWKTPTTPTTEQQQASMDVSQEQTTMPAADISGTPADVSVYKQLADLSEPGGNTREKMRYLRYLFEHLPEDLRVDQNECRRNARLQGLGGLALFAGGTYVMRQMVGLTSRLWLWKVAYVCNSLTGFFVFSFNGYNKCLLSKNFNERFQRWADAFLREDMARTAQMPTNAPAYGQSTPQPPWQPRFQPIPAENITSQQTLAGAVDRPKSYEELRAKNRQFSV